MPRRCRSARRNACLVAALEAVAGDWLDDQAEWLVQHALWGEVWDKSLAYGRQAGDKARTRSAYREPVCMAEAVDVTRVPRGLAHERSVYDATDTQRAA